MKGNQIGVEGCRYIAEGLRQLKILRIRNTGDYLEKNCIGDEGLIALSKGLKQLVTLDIGIQPHNTDNCRCGPLGLATLA